MTREAALRRAIAIVEDSRRTHVHWAEWRRNGGAGDEMAGDLKHHEDAITGYDHVLSVLRALASAPSDPEPVAELDVEQLTRALEQMDPAMIVYFARGDWKGTPRKFARDLAAEYASLSDRRHLLEAERQRQVRENEPEAPA